ncbi:MAG: hypothetical protein J0L92_02685 [Deltaproteobacteria bacterium]|nr:hypothetical protein [Deltaproteobacteria bacterium]
MHTVHSKRISRAVMARVLALHERAYAILLGLGRAALSDAAVLSREAESALLDRRRAAAWLRAHGWCDDVAAADHDALGALVGSFFHTSFHVHRFELGGEVDAQLRLGPGHAAPSHARRARHGGSASREALHRICRDEGLRVDHAALRLVAQSSSLRDDARLWTYAVGLVARARGGGEGAADWAAWRVLRRHAGRSLDVDAVWEARERLLVALSREASR